MSTIYHLYAHGGRNLVYHHIMDIARYVFSKQVDGWLPSPLGNLSKDGQMYCSTLESVTVSLTN